MLIDLKKINRPTVAEYNELVRVLTCTRMDLLILLQENFELRKKLKELEEEHDDDRK